MYLFQRIEELMVQYDDARRMIASFVLEKQKDLYKYTIDEIAEVTFTSKPTVTRFAKILGFQGWKDFKKAFIEELKYQDTYKNMVDVNFPFTEQDDIRGIVQNIKQVQIDSLEDTMKQMDFQMLRRAVNYLVNAKRVAIFGSSPNIYLGELFRRKLLTIGKAAEVVHVEENGIMAYCLGRQDCAIILSYSGNNETRSYIRCVKNLLEQKVPMIGITSGGNNYLRQNLDCVLTMSSRERLYTKISTFATEESLGYILNVLYSCYFAREYQKNISYKVSNASVLESGRYANLKEMQENRND